MEDKDKDSVTKFCIVDEVGQVIGTPKFEN